MQLSIFNYAATAAFSAFEESRNPSNKDFCLQKDLFEKEQPADTASNDRQVIAA